jgi:hypothetical protein
MIAHICNSSSWEQRQEALEFQAIWAHIRRPYLKKKKKKRKKEKGNGKQTNKQKIPTIKHLRECEEIGTLSVDGNVT